MRSGASKGVKVNPLLLMIPGPSQPEPEVLSALSLPVIPHYGSEWMRVYTDTISKLQKVFGTKNEVILFPAAGQAVVEMAANCLIRKGEEAYVCSNGFFSTMIEQILKFRGAKVMRIAAELGEPVTSESVSETLESTPKRKTDGKSIFLVHNETSTGVLNPAREIMREAKNLGMITILDSISSFGGIEIKADEWKADYCIGYSSKAIGGVYGVIPVSVSRECFELAKKNKSQVHSKLLNLNVWREYIDEWSAWGHPHPTSMPSSVVVALNKALDLVLEEGLKNRYARHKEAARTMRNGLKSIGLELFPNRNYLSSTVTVANVDPSYDEKLRNELLERYDIMIAGGLEELRGKIIRIGHMGNSAIPSNVLITLNAIRDILRNLNKNVVEKEKANRRT